MRTIFDRNLVRKYDRPGPRYTSYPPATEFTEEVGEEDYRRKLVESNARKTPLSLYFHIPFCESGCYYCGCNYLRRVYREMELIDRSRKVVQLHWGGGTPNYLTPEEIEEFMGEIRKRFSFSEDAEVSIEIDPRFATDHQLRVIRDAGFNRISMGLQDLDERVQRAINRIQPYSLMVEVMGKLRDLGFHSINIDLIYGLPHQTRSSFEKTVEKVIELDPDRIAVYSFAYVPWVKPIQKRIDPGLRLHRNGSLCEARRRAGGSPAQGRTLEKLSGLHNAQGGRTLRNRGYLHRNASGFLLSELQNPEIMCNLGVNFRKIDDRFGIVFEDYFEKELEELRELEEDGLIRVKDRRIEILPAGRMLIRNVAMVFDAYLRTKKELRFSKTI